METLLANELKGLGIEPTRSTIAGVAFEGNLETAYRACLWSRTANRILLQLATFTVKTQEDLYTAAQKIDWFEHIAPDSSFAVTFSAKNAPAINNTHFGALRVKDAIVDQMRQRFNNRPRIDTEHPDILINVYLQGEIAQLSLDLSGESLHRRGYRDINIKAPIKENLAAAMLLRSGWPKIAGHQGSLCDPMCGSGTLLVEGALIAADYAPGLLRDYYGFLGWKLHDPACWQRLKAEAEQRRSVGLTKLPVIVGFDQDRATVNTALAHITNAGLQNKIHVERRDIEFAKPADNWKPGLLICNPPYGERLGDEQETADLYKKMGETLKANFRNWEAALIISNPELGFRLGIRSKKPITLFNGALECKLLRLTIDESAFFIPKAKTRDERIALVTENSKINPQEITDDEIVAYPDVSKEREPGVISFANRVKKNLSKLSKWSKKNQISCFRVYDADLPEYAVAIDLYQGDKTWISVQEYEPPKSIDPQKANQRLAGLLSEIPTIFGVNRDRIFLKIRRKQKSADQYEKQGNLGHFHIIQEGGCKLLVNFEDYLDTGLFLDHRPIRQLIQQQAKNKRFLNLFGYTGTATVHAAIGGASASTTVDMSNTYLNWAKNNLDLNIVSGDHELIQADCLGWLAHEAEQTLNKRQYDLIFLDPPTFSNSKRMSDVLDIQIDHVPMIKDAASLLAPGGVLYFSTNFRRFKIDLEALSSLRIEDISASTIPEDFARNPKIHYCWKITK